MKVTFCAHDHANYVNGPNVWMRRLLPALCGYGVQPRVLFITWSAEECPTVLSLRRQGINCREIYRPQYTEQRVHWVVDRLAEDPPDVFVPNLMVPAYYAGRWVRKAGIPTVGVLHSDDAFYRGLLSEFVFGADTYQLSALVCVSKFLEQAVLSQRPDRVLVRRIPYGAPLPQRVARKPNGKLRVAYVGRLVEQQKHISEVTRALCRAISQVVNTEGVIYGEGPARPAIEQILREQAEGLPVHMGGRVDSDQIQDRLLECHALALLSDYEGLPISVMEAMACGVVPICLRMRSGVPELIEDGVTGLLVRDREGDFVAAVRRLREEPGLWERLSRAARAKIEADYSDEACAALWESFLRELHSTTRPNRALRIPHRVTLPSIHPALAREDHRRPPLYRLFLQRSRRAAGRIKRQFLGG
jgi:colanic acid/amylovoran biosynthesis glycosyltransferase